MTFNSQAPELSSAPSTDAPEIFIKDMLTGAVRLVSKTVTGGWGEDYSDSGCISDDGSVVAFTSASASLVPMDTNGIGDVFVRALIPLVKTKPVLCERLRALREATSANMASRGPRCR